MYQEKLERMKEFKELMHFLQAIHQITHLHIYTPVFYIWLNPSPRNREKNLANSKRSNRNPLNAAIKSFANQL